MKVRIVIRDTPDGNVDVSFKQYGARRPGGAGAEQMANSIIKGLAIFKRAHESLIASGGLPAAEAAHDSGDSIGDPDVAGTAG